MPFEEGQPSLTSYLAEEPLKQIVKKRLFGKRYVRLWDYFRFLGFQYESGAILGSAKRDKMSTLVNILVVPGADADEFMRLMQEQANKRLEKFRNELGKEPDTFYDFIFYRELDKFLVDACGLTLKDIAIFMEKDGTEYRVKDKKIRKVIYYKVPFEMAWRTIQEFGLEGIGFGSAFPELTQTMFSNFYDNTNIERDYWAAVRKLGLEIPKKPELADLHQRELIVLILTADYVSNFWPEFLDPLDLRVYTEEEMVPTELRD